MQTMRKHFPSLFKVADGVRNNFGILVRYLVLGFFVAFAQLIILSEWGEIIKRLTGEAFHFDRQSNLSRFLGFMVNIAPWVYLVVLLIQDVLQRKMWRTFAYTLGMGMFWGVLISSILLGPGLMDRLQRKEFNPETWKNHELVFREPYPRKRMVNDVLAKYDFEGMSKSEVELILGQPDPEPTFRPKGYDWLYFLGRQRIFLSVDHEWLCISFSQNVVTRVKVLRNNVI